MRQTLGQRSDSPRRNAATRVTPPQHHAAYAVVVATTRSSVRPSRPDGGLLLGRVHGVPVQLSSSWWLGAAVITLLYTPLVGNILPGTALLPALLLGLAFAVSLGLSVLLHELGHCMVALRFGLPVRRLRLYLLGGASELARTPANPRQEGMIAAAGPAVSIGLALVSGLGWFALHPGTALWLLVAETAVANIAVAVFNLLPGLPLDGGRMLRAGVWAATGARAKGTRAGVLGAGIVAAALALWALLGFLDAADDRWLRIGVCAMLVWFVIDGAGAELAAEQRRNLPHGLRIADVARPVLQLPAESPVADALAASAGRGVVLVRADGVAVGLLDQQLAERLASRSPLAPAEEAAEPIRPETVLLDSESDADIIERIRQTAAWQFLLVDSEGRPAGVVHRRDLRPASGSADSR